MTLKETDKTQIHEFLIENAGSTLHLYNGRRDTHPRIWNSSTHPLVWLAVMFFIGFLIGFQIWLMAKIPALLGGVWFIFLSLGIFSAYFNVIYISFRQLYVLSTQWAEIIITSDIVLVKFRWPIQQKIYPKKKITSINIGKIPMGNSRYINYHPVMIFFTGKQFMAEFTFPDLSFGGSDDFFSVLLTELKLQFPNIPYIINYGEEIPRNHTKSYRWYHFSGFILMLGLIFIGLGFIGL